MRHRLFNGGRKEQSLAGSRHGLQNEAKGGQETHVEHAVGFVQYEELHAAEVDQAAVQKVAQAAGRRNQNLSALPDSPQLLAFAHASHRHGGLDAHAVGDLGERFVGLDGEFARGAEDEGLDAALAASARQRLEQRKQKRQGLARSGLRGGHQVLAGQRRRNRLGLHRGRLDKALLCQVALQARAQ